MKSAPASTLDSASLRLKRPAEARAPEIALAAPERRRAAVLGLTLGLIATAACFVGGLAWISLTMGYSPGEVL